MKNLSRIGSLYLVLLQLSNVSSAEQPVVVNIKRLSLDTALTMAQATIEQCRKEGVQITVTIIDRGARPQVVLRDVLAMDLSVKISMDKAYTAMSFNMPTSEFAKRSNSFPQYDGIFAGAGGLPITAGGNILGGIGVSGAPSGETDEKCAKAGLDAIMADLEMEVN